MEVKMNDVLIVKINALFPTETLSEIRKHILRQKESGVIVLPSYCEALVVPEDIEIKLEADLNGEE